MDLGLDNKRALVTGASKGLGKAVASALRAEGAAVAICSRSSERIEGAAKDIGAVGLTGDLSVPRPTCCGKPSIVSAASISLL